MPRSSQCSTVKFLTWTHVLVESRMPCRRFPTSDCCAPGLPTPVFTYKPAPFTQRNVPAGIDCAVPLEAARRCPSTNTWIGLHVTDAATYTVPDTCDHRLVEA